MKLSKCLEHGYTLKQICDKCKQQTKPAHYKFIKIKSAEEFISEQALP